MNNAAFRSLVTSKPAQDGGESTTFKKPTALGSRARSTIPMTPRNVPGYAPNREFARQVAEHTTSTEGPPLKKFKSSAAPKGTKLGAGYVDRAQLRQGEDEKSSDDLSKAERLKNLEEQFKLGQIDEAQFELLKEQIGVGGDVSSTHLVKGLDWKLLQRVRKGEDVTKSANNTEDAEQVPEVDVDEELENALQKEVIGRRKNEDTAEQEQGAPQVMSRDEILRRFREQRNVPAAPVLNDRFRKVPSSDKSGKKKFVESVNGRRREVLVITNKDGTTKRKTRWIDPENAAKPEQERLGMEVPAEILAKQKALLEAEAAADDNEDIFADAGNDYDPLAGIDSDSESDEEQEKTKQVEPNVSAVAKKRNYFSAGKDKVGTEDARDTPASDPTILAALKRAAELRKREEVEDRQTGVSSTDPDEKEAGAKSSAFLAKLKERERQDAADFDYGFGESRFGDDDDEDVGPLYDDEDGDNKKKSGRKRGPKKRKGNKDNVQDVMSVLEGRSKPS